MDELFSNAEFWVAVAFVIFVGIIFWKGYRRIVDGLDARAAGIKNELDEARTLREEAQALLATFQRKQRDALKEAEGIVEQAKEEAGRASVAANAALEEQIKRRTEMAMDKIARAETQALQDVRDTAVDVAVDAARTLIEKNLDKAKAASLVDESIEDLDKKLH